MEPPIITKSKLIADFASIGISVGDTVMLNASVKAIGWLVGGPDTILTALREIIGDRGTLVMYVSWEDGTYELSEWPKEKRDAYLRECPPFAAATSRAYRKWSILTEYLRTTPGSFRSGNPEWSMCAVGEKAQWITADHPLQYGSGLGSPLEKLCQVKGKVLLLGTPLSTLTFLHYAENIADVPDKRIVQYRQPIIRNVSTEWVEIEEFDSSDGIREWEAGEDYFDCIVEEYLASGKGMKGMIGAATSHLLDAAEINAFAVSWLEKTFGR